MASDSLKELVLENEKVLVESLKEEHAETLKLIAQDSEIWTFFLGESDGSKDFDRYLEIAFLKQRDSLEYPLVILDKTQKEVLGMTRLYDYQPAWKSIRMGSTWFGKAGRGTGLNYRSKYLIFQYLFEKLGIERIGFGVHQENIRSIAAMFKLGCTLEGVQAKLFPSVKGPGRADNVLFSVLRSQWHDHFKNRLKILI